MSENKCQHIAFIMDGNGRWAKKRGLPRHLGHKEGCRRIMEIARACQDLGIKAMTLYAFSTENWNRPQDEIDHLFYYLDDFFNDNIREFMQRKIHIVVSGDYSRLPEHSIATLKKSLEMTKDNDAFYFNICLNYGSQQEILKACKEIAEEAKEGKLNPEEITKEIFESHLYTHELPPVDLMVRTSGEQRLSNYLLYQLAYAEFIFNPTYWPDYTKKELLKDLELFATRDRRYGKIEKQ